MKYSERNHEKRIEYLRELRSIVTERGSDNVVYVDESGFEASSHRPHGWALCGKKVHGEYSGNTRPRTSLIAGKREKDLLAPVLFEGRTYAILFNCWLEEHLLSNSKIVLNNFVVRLNSMSHISAVGEKEKEVVEQEEKLLFLVF